MVWPRVVLLSARWEYRCNSLGVEGEVVMPGLELQTRAPFFRNWQMMASICHEMGFWGVQ